MRRPLHLRARLTAVAALVSAVVVGALILVFNLLLSSSLSRDVDHRLRTSAAAASTTVVVGEDGRIRVREGPGDGAIDTGIWVYAGVRALARSPQLTRAERVADSMAGRAYVYRDVPGEHVRLYAVPIRSGRRQVGTIVSAVSLTAYDRTTTLALGGSVALGVTMLLALAGLVWGIVGRALRPVREMTETAARWSASTHGERFGDEPRPDELGRLARTFDLLLDRVAASVRHEQRLSAELSHELRTPLASIMAEAELLLRRERGPRERREAIQTIHTGAERMQQILDTLLAAARAEASGHTTRGDVGAAVARVAAHASGPGPLIVAPGPAPAGGSRIAGVDEPLVERMVAPLVENARRHARTRVELSVAAAPGRVVVEVRDDGPGVAPADAERIFDPGVRIGVDDHPGAGLGLALARRLARAAGGELTAIAGDGGRFRLELPAA